MRNLLAELSAPFTELTASKPLFEDDPFTNVTLVRNTCIVEDSSSNAAAAGTGLNLCSTVRCQGTVVHIANVHGLPKPGKLDNLDRIRQSQEILDAFASLSGIKIIGGDLNVLPETESVRVFEAAGYKNLIKDFGIKTTRNKIAWAKHPGNELYYSDYVFVSGASVASFEVPAEIVSDHQPMILTVNL